MLKSNMEAKFETLLSKCEIPIIDLAHVGTDVCPMKSVVIRAGAQLKNAFSQKGLALLVNHGISEDKLKAVYSSLDDFCDLPAEIKEIYLRKSPNNHGYVKPGMEKFDGETPELRHTFNICDLSDADLPEDYLPGFKNTVLTLATDFKRLSILLLKALAIGLDLPDQYFIEKHSTMLEGQDVNASTLRLLYYPPLVADEHDEEIDYIKGTCGYDKIKCEKKKQKKEEVEEDGVKPKITRCGEHCDYGTFTLLAQDSEGGLEAKLPNSERWQRVGHLPGAILINTGELLAAWTLEKYPALPHRVIIPEQAYVRSRGRHSIAFFCHPDNSTLITPLTLPAAECACAEACKKTARDHIKNAKLRVFTAYQHLQRRFRETYAS